MSRIGKLPIHVPAGVTVTIKDSVVTVKGPKGEMTQAVNTDINVTLEDGVIHLTRPTDDKNHRALHGLYRSLINNMVIGVSEGYKKELELVGVGYKAEKKGKKLVLSLGYSHPVELEDPDGITTEAPSNTEITVKGIDKAVVGNYAANIRAWRKPEPYKGKGIRYVGEHIRRKEGKTGAK